MLLRQLPDMMRCRKCDNTGRIRLVVGGAPFGDDAAEGPSDGVGVLYRTPGQPIASPPGSGSFHCAGVPFIFQSVLDLSRSNVANELGEGYRVARAFDALSGHG